MIQSQLRLSGMKMFFHGRVSLIRTLTLSVLEIFAPAKLADFEREFAPFVLAGGVPQVQERLAVMRTQDQGLDTTLVAGMFFQVLVEAEQLPASTSDRVSYVRKQAKNYLVNRLAGQISMSQFFRLLSLIDEHVQRYFTGLRSSWVNPPPEAISPPSVPLTIADSLELEALRQALAHLPAEAAGRRKLSREKLMEFLQSTRGESFKLIDFEENFQVNKKTAWACLNQLLDDGILVHNGEKANKVRYSLASRFLREESAP
jgi:hypothetical protein